MLSPLPRIVNFNNLHPLQIARDVAEDVPHLSSEDVTVIPMLQMWQYHSKAVP